MNRRKLHAGLGAVLVAIGVITPSLSGQTTWIYTSTNPTSGPPVSRNYSVDSLVPSDPKAPGSFVRLATANCIGPVANPSLYEGGVAVDRMSSTVITTDGQQVPNAIGGMTIQLEFQPTTPGSCSPGYTSCQLVKGSIPSSMVQNIIGIDVEYWTNPVTQLDEPYRLWVATPFRYTWIWLTKNNPTGQRPRWNNQAWVNPFNYPLHDIAFGHVTIFPGGIPGPRTAALWGVGLGGWVYVWDPIAQTQLYSFPSRVQNQLAGITIDTSVPKQGFIVNMPPIRAVSGRVLLLEDNYPNTDRIWDITTIPINNWYVGGFGGLSQPYKAGMAASQELVSLGSPCGTCGGGPGMPGSIPSTAVADILWSPTGNLPGQPLTTVALNMPPLNSTHFRVEACSVPITPSGVTPYLVLQKNGFGPAATTCLALDPTVSHVVPGFPMFDPSRYYADVHVGTVPDLPPSPIPSNTSHYYFGQWVFMCGTGTAFDPLNLPFMASDPFRIGVSNPH